eukprot:34980_1
MSTSLKLRKSQTDLTEERHEVAIEVYSAKESVSIDWNRDYDHFVELMAALSAGIVFLNEINTAGMDMTQMIASTIMYYIGHTCPKLNIEKFQSKKHRHTTSPSHRSCFVSIFYLNPTKSAKPNRTNYTTPYLLSAVSIPQMIEPRCGSFHVRVLNRKLKWININLIHDVPLQQTAIIKFKNKNKKQPMWQMVSYTSDHKMLFIQQSQIKCQTNRRRKKHSALQLSQYTIKTGTKLELNPNPIRFMWQQFNSNCIYALQISNAHWRFIRLLPDVKYTNTKFEAKQKRNTSRYQTRSRSKVKKPRVKPGVIHDEVSLHDLTGFDEVDVVEPNYKVKPKVILSIVEPEWIIRRQGTHVYKQSIVGCWYNTRRKVLFVVISDSQICAIHMGNKKGIKPSMNVLKLNIRKYNGLIHYDTCSKSQPLRLNGMYYNTDNDHLYLFYEMKYYGGTKDVMIVQLNAKRFYISSVNKVFKFTEKIELNSFKNSDYHHVLRTNYEKHNKFVMDVFVSCKYIFGGNADEWKTEILKHMIVDYNQNCLMIMNEIVKGDERDYVMRRLDFCYIVSLLDNRELRQENENVFFKSRTSGVKVSNRTTTRRTTNTNTHYEPPMYGLYPDGNGGWHKSSNSDCLIM